MDARLRILQRQAQSSGTAEDWARFAGALQKTLAGEDVEDVYIWVAEVAGRTFSADFCDYYFFATETEARGHVMNHLADAVGEIGKVPEIDYDWYAKYQQWLQLTERGDYDAAWELYWENTTGLVECDQNAQTMVHRHLISRCSPDHPPATDCLNAVQPW